MFSGSLEMVRHIATASVVGCITFHNSAIYKMYEFLDYVNAEMIGIACLT